MIIATLEDDAAEAELIRHILVAAGHECVIFGTGAALLADLRLHTYDLLVLDWNLPDMTGYEVLNWVRSNLSAKQLVLFVSNRALEENIVLALMSGGDDYMVKPVRRAELLARIHALARRRSAETPQLSDAANAAEGLHASHVRTEHRTHAHHGVATPASGHHAVLEIGAYRFDKIRKEAQLHGQLVDLKPKEFDIACMLMENIGAIVSRLEITEAVWGRELMMTSRTLDTHMSHVRSKLALKPENNMKLSTIYTLGYRLDRLE